MLDDAFTRILAPSAWAMTGRWDGFTATWPGATATQAAPGGLDKATVRATLTLGTTAALMLRVTDTGHLQVQADPVAHTLSLWRVDGPTRTMLVQAPGDGVDVGATVTLRVDVDGPHVTLYALDGARLVSASAIDTTASPVLGVTQLGDGATGLESVTVAALQGPSINWPVFSHRQAQADIRLGAAGSWEDTDINNPNIVWDPKGSRWVMYYTGYSASKPTGDDGVQMAGIAYATTLDGPWTKDTNNPVISDLATGAWSQNGGLERLPDGSWLIAANVNYGSMYGPNMGTWFYRAPEPGGPYTRWSEIVPGPYVGDPYLRWNQITGRLEHWAWTYGAGGRVGARWTSTDNGKTWAGPEHIVPRPGIHGVNSGEQAIFVAPGREDRETWVTTDFYPQTVLDAGRGMLIGMTPDQGATWFWHVAQTPAGSLGWDRGAAFDSTVVYDEPRRRLYLYHSGSTRRDTGVLNMSIQIGHCWADWDHTVPAYTKGT